MTARSTDLLETSRRKQISTGGGGGGEDVLLVSISADCRFNQIGVAVPSGPAMCRGQEIDMDIIALWRTCIWIPKPYYQLSLTQWTVFFVHISPFGCEN